MGMRGPMMCLRGGGPCCSKPQPLLASKDVAVEILSSDAEASLEPAAPPPTPDEPKNGAVASASNGEGRDRAASDGGDGISPLQGRQRALTTGSVSPEGSRPRRPSLRADRAPPSLPAGRVGFRAMEAEDAAATPAHLTPEALKRDDPEQQMRARAKTDAHARRQRWQSASGDGDERRHSVSDFLDASSAGARRRYEAGKYLYQGDFAPEPGESDAAMARHASRTATARSCLPERARPTTLPLDTHRNNTRDGAPWPTALHARHPSLTLSALCPGRRLPVVSASARGKAGEAACLGALGGRGCMRPPSTPMR